MERNAIWVMVTLALALALVVTGCAGSRRGEAPEPPKASWVNDTLVSLTLEQKVGQMIYPRSDGVFANESDESLRALVAAARAGRIGGVVFFKGEPLETAAIANRLQEASPLPLLMASDYEWGPAMRIEGASRFPKAMAMAAGASEDDIELQATVTAREARAMGVHLLLNPVVDLLTNPANTVIGTRSWGSDPAEVARLGSIYIERAQSLGVLTTAKHFPGHGATEVDSHVDLPVVQADRESLRNVELVPFRAAVKAGVAAIMPAHLAVPALGGPADQPATISKEILQGVLRGELGFDGLIVSDALEMGGARQGAWDGEVVVAAVQAGVDMLLVPPDALVTYQAVLRAVRRGDISEARIDESVRRILSAKARLDLHRRRTVELADVLRVVNARLSRERIEAMARQAITLVRNQDALVPLSSAEPPDVLLVDYRFDGDRITDPDILAEELERRARRVRRVRVTPATVESMAARIRPEGDEVIVVASYTQSRDLLGPGERSAALADTLNELARDGTRVIFSSLGTPFALNELSEVGTLVATYDFAPPSQRALAQALFGEFEVKGRLPVRLSEEYARGHGLHVVAQGMRLEQLENPKRVDLSKRQLDAAVDLVRRAIDEGATPGAVVLIARRGHIVVEEALGKMSYDEDAEPVRRDTMYDLASLTKVIVTTTLSMILHERELLDLDSPVRDYLPEFDGGDKQIVLVKDLLAHSGGLLWWTDLYKKFEGQPLEDAKRGYLQTIYEMPLDYTPRSKTVYSDLGIFLMGEILERITGKALDVLAKEEIFEPLEMDETMFRPPESLRSRIAPTERDEWRGRVVHGEVHDENAYGFGGVAPHAGLFSTARSLAPFVQMLLNGGAYDGRRLINGATIELFTTRAGLVADSSRALGWDTPSGRSSSGKFFSASSFGHTGFTGVSIWIDPERELFTILLTNRVHPTRENRKLYDVRAGFHDAVIEAITDIEVLPRVEE
jgi:beta-glucosidase-like glycosyl hydrolase/CubicO group peptidase (beta-lactamase class C family)